MNQWTSLLTHQRFPEASRPFDTMENAMNELKAEPRKHSRYYRAIRVVATAYGAVHILILANLWTTHQFQDAVSAKWNAAGSTSSGEFAGGHLYHSVDPSESLSSCLMVMDDNHRLPEWLAYNYYAMNLRHLVILSDPAGRESPTRVLDPWRESITIEEWTEEDYFDKGLRQRTKGLEGVKNPSPDDAQDYFLERQSKFIKSCSLHLQSQNRTWVSFHDIDEYYVINSDIVKNTNQRMEDPGSVIKLINEVQENATSLQSSSDLVIPEQYTGPCVTTYRVPYGAVESSEVERGQDVPSFLDPRQFETLRWRNHGDKAIIGKSLVDVSKLPALRYMGWSDRKKTPFSPHQLIPFCPHVQYHPNAFVVLNHYLGSWESYTFRANDSRQGNLKNRKEWEKIAYRKGGKRGDDIRPWITGFVRMFGEQRTKILLGDIGLPADYTVSHKADAWQESKLPSRMTPRARRVAVRAKRKRSQSTKRRTP
jgi:hypothetical protein